MSNKHEDEDPDDAFADWEAKQEHNYYAMNTPRPGQKWAPADFEYDTPGSKKE